MTADDVTQEALTERPADEAGEASTGPRQLALLDAPLFVRGPTRVPVARRVRSSGPATLTLPGFAPPVVERPVVGPLPVEPVPDLSGAAVDQASKRKRRPRGQAPSEPSEALPPTESTKPAEPTEPTEPAEFRGEKPGPSAAEVPGSSPHAGPRRRTTRPTPPAESHGEKPGLSAAEVPGPSPVSSPIARATPTRPPAESRGEKPGLSAAEVPGQGPRPVAAPTPVPAPQPAEIFTPPPDATEAERLAAFRTFVRSIGRSFTARREPPPPVLDPDEPLTEARLFARVAQSAALDGAPASDTPDRDPPAPDSLPDAPAGTDADADEPSPGEGLVGVLFPDPSSRSGRGGRTGRGGRAPAPEIDPDETFFAGLAPAPAGVAARQALLEALGMALVGGTRRRDGVDCRVGRGSFVTRLVDAGLRVSWSDPAAKAQWLTVVREVARTHGLVEVE